MFFCRNIIQCFEGIFVISHRYIKEMKNIKPIYKKNRPAIRTTSFLLKNTITKLEGSCLSDVSLYMCISV